MAENGERRDEESLWLREAARTPDHGTAFGGMPRPGDVIANKYRIVRMLGAGGMGAVFEAVHLMMGSPVALKWLIPGLGDQSEARERFLREARIAAQIRHPNVVQVFDMGEEAGSPYMVMELLDGESFEAAMERSDLSTPTLLALLAHAMRGVQAAHERGVVHRDIKPENIFVVRDPTQPSALNAKVLDFGISKLSKAYRTGITRSGVVMGTPAYMSLEQLNGARDVDARADVYAFGVLMYRVLTGRLPFEGETFVAIATAAAMHRPPAPKELRPELPAALSNEVMRAMARERDHRHGSAGELLAALTAPSAAEPYLGGVTRRLAASVSSRPGARPDRPGVAQDEQAAAEPSFAGRGMSGRGKRALAVAAPILAAVAATLLWLGNRTPAVEAGAESGVPESVGAPAVKASPAIAHEASREGALSETAAVDERASGESSAGLTAEEGDEDRAEAEQAAPTQTPAPLPGAPIPTGRSKQGALAAQGREAKGVSGDASAVPPRKRRLRGTTSRKGAGAKPPPDDEQPTESDLHHAVRHRSKGLRFDER